MARDERRPDPPAAGRAKRSRAALGRAGTLLAKSVEAFADHHGTQLAAGMSYYAILSVFPAAIVMVAVFGIVIGDSDARTEVVDALLEALPLTDAQGRGDLESTIGGVTRNAEAVGIVGLAALLLTASALMGSARNAVHIAIADEEPRPALRGKALDLLFVAGLGLLVGLSLGATIVRGFALDLGEDLGLPGRWMQSTLDVAGEAVPLALTVAAFTAIYLVLPRRHVPLRDAWPAIAFASIGYELAKRGFSLYLESFARYDDIYGSLGAVIAFMVFVYIAAIVFIVGAEMVALWPRVRRGEFESTEPGEPLRDQVLGFLKGLVVERRK
jgi:membrane protein